jgi:hypothetical protein
MPNEVADEALGSTCHVNIGVILVDDDVVHGLAVRDLVQRCGSSVSETASLLYQADHALGDRLFGVAPADELACRISAIYSVAICRAYLEQSSPDVLWIDRRERTDIPSVSKLAKSARARRKHWQACIHRLKDGHGKALGVAWQYKHVVIGK